MRSRSIVAGAVSLAALIGSVPLRAHHAFAAEYDRDKPITLTGTVTKLEWTNPHARIYIDVKDDKGEVVNWDFELGPPNGLMRRGWNRNSLKAGHVVTIEGFLLQDQSARGQRPFGEAARTAVRCSPARPSTPAPRRKTPLDEVAVGTGTAVAGSVRLLRRQPAGSAPAWLHAFCSSCAPSWSVAAGRARRTLPRQQREASDLDAFMARVSRGATTTGSGCSSTCSTSARPSRSSDRAARPSTASGASTCGSRATATASSSAARSRVDGVKLGEADRRKAEAD